MNVGGSSGYPLRDVQPTGSDNNSESRFFNV